MKFSPCSAAKAEKKDTKPPMVEVCGEGIYKLYDKGGHGFSTTNNRLIIAKACCGLRVYLWVDLAQNTFVPQKISAIDGAYRAEATGETLCMEIKS